MPIYRAELKYWTEERKFRIQPEMPKRNPQVPRGVPLPQEAEIRSPPGRGGDGWEGSVRGDDGLRQVDE